MSEFSHFSRHAAKLRDYFTSMNACINQVHNDAVDLSTITPDKPASFRSTPSSPSFITREEIEQFKKTQLSRILGVKRAHRVVKKRPRRKLTQWSGRGSN